MPKMDSDIDVLQGKSPRIELQGVRQFGGIIRPVNECACGLKARTPIPWPIDSDEADLRIPRDAIRQPHFQTRSRKPVKKENRSALPIAEFGKANPAPVAKGYLIVDIV